MRDRESAAKGPNNNYAADDESLISAFEMFQEQKENLPANDGKISSADQARSSQTAGVLSRTMNRLSEQMAIEPSQEELQDCETANDELRAWFKVNR